MKIHNIDRYIRFYKQAIKIKSEVTLHNYSGTYPTTSSMKLIICLFPSTVFSVIYPTSRDIKLVICLHNWRLKVIK